MGSKNVPYYILALLLFGCMACLIFEALVHFDDNNDNTVNDALYNISTASSQQQGLRDLRHIIYMPDAMLEVKEGRTFLHHNVSREFGGCFHGMQSVYFALLMLMLFVTVWLRLQSTRYVGQIKRAHVTPMALSLGGQSPPVPVF